VGFVGWLPTARVPIYLVPFYPPLLTERNKMNLDKHIRCKCGKFWGMRNHGRKCKRCQYQVIARGEKK